MLTDTSAEFAQRTNAWQNTAGFSRLHGSGGRTDTQPVMPWKRKVTGGVVAFVGFMLSPLSWWNDLFVNVPLALVFASVVSFFYRPAFEASAIVGYWLTNVVGLVLLQKGGEQMLSKHDKPYSRRALLRDVGISLIYTLVIVLLLRLDILKPIQAYFDQKSGR
jgi:hypothetical protein